MRRTLIILGALFLVISLMGACAPAAEAPPAEPTPPPPSAITGLVAADAYDGRVNLNWDKSTAEDFDHYNIYIGESEIVDVTGMMPVHEIGDITNTSYQATGLEDGTNYYFAVTVIDKSGSENTRVASVSAVPTPLLSAEFLETVRLLDTPGKVSSWLGQNIKYKSEDVNEYAPAWVIFERGYDDCDGHATIQAYFLKANGYDAWNIGIAIETPYGHNVCGYKENDKWFVLDTNGVMRGPFESLEQLADEVGNLVKIPKGSSIYLIDPFDVVSTTSFPKYEVYRD